MKNYLITILLTLFVTTAFSQVTITVPSQCITAGHADTDWNKSGTSNAPDEITDTIYTYGNVGIGTASPQYPLHIVPALGEEPFKMESLLEDSTLTRVLVVTADGIVRVQNTGVGQASAISGHNFYQVGSTHGATDISQEIYTMGNVGIGISSPTHLLHVNGVARSTQSSWATSSDERVKENIHNIENALQTVMDLRPVEFDWKAEYRETNQLPLTQYGFIAQEVKAVVPRMVKEIEEPVGDDVIEDFNLLNTSEMTPLLVGSVQELYEMVRKLQSENTDLRRELEALKLTGQADASTETLVNQENP